MIRRVCILGACLALLPAVSQAALVLLVEGVPGPSRVKNYSGWFDMDSVAWGIDRSNVAAPHTLTVTLAFSANVATLAQASASGAVFRKIAVDQISFVLENAQLVSRLVCEEASIREFSSSAHSGDHGKVDLDIRCAKLAWEGFDYDSTKNNALAKSAKGSWNFKTNTP